MAEHGVSGVVRVCVSTVSLVRASIETFGATQVISSRNKTFYTMLSCARQMMHRGKKSYFPRILIIGTLDGIDDNI